ncbi:MAG: hypothetical protein J6M02_05685 [Clostridia bacterium]|nr:hypothetical protein [Clostridia bacterium]
MTQKKLNKIVKLIKAGYSNKDIHKIEQTSESAIAYIRKELNEGCLKDVI